MDSLITISILAGRKASGLEFQMSNTETVDTPFHDPASPTPDAEETVDLPDRRLRDPAVQRQFNGCDSRTMATGR